MKTKSRVEDLLQADGSRAVADEDKVRVVNAHFSSGFTEENENIPAPSTIYGFQGKKSKGKW